jgi:hypothetical protein
MQRRLLKRATRLISYEAEIPRFAGSLRAFHQHCTSYSAPDICHSHELCGARMWSFAAVLFLLLYFVFALCERKNEIQIQWEVPCCRFP